MKTKTRKKVSATEKKSKSKTARGGFAVPRLLAIAAVVVAVVALSYFVWLQRDNLSNAESDSSEGEAIASITSDSSETVDVNGETVSNETVESIPRGKYDAWISANSIAWVWACRLTDNPRDGVRIKGAFAAGGRWIKGGFKAAGGYNFPARNTIQPNARVKVIRYGGSGNNPIFGLLGSSNYVSRQLHRVSRFNGIAKCGSDWDALTKYDYNVYGPS